MHKYPVFSQDYCCHKWVYRSHKSTTSQTAMLCQNLLHEATAANADKRDIQTNDQRSLRLNFPNPSFDNSLVLPRPRNNHLGDHNPKRREPPSAHLAMRLGDLSRISEKCRFRALRIEGASIAQRH